MTRPIDAAAPARRLTQWMGRRRWFQRQFERVQVCPRCQRAVLIEPPPA